MAIDLTKLAMPTSKLLVLAICGHLRRFEGKLPLRLEMHPAVEADLIATVDPCAIYFSDAGKPEFHGVPIVVDVQYERLKLVNADNEIEYI